MDPITHGFLGAAVSQSLTTKPLGKKAAWIGAAAAMSPDLDIFIRSAQNPSLFLIYHRHFTHSLAFILLGGLLVSVVLLLLFKKLRPQWSYVILAAIAAYATHGLLDAATSYGTLLFWPFADTRVAWDVISIIDPIFTLLLVVGVTVTYVKGTRTAVCLALFFAAIYLGFGYWQHARALSLQQQLAKTRHQVIVKGRAMPEMGHLLGFRSIYIADDDIYLDDLQTPIFHSAYAVSGTLAPLYRQQDLPKKIKNNPVLLYDFKVFNWFSDGFISALSYQPLVIGDMRYVRMLNPLQVAWAIEFPDSSTRQHVYWQSGF